MCAREELPAREPILGIGRNCSSERLTDSDLAAFHGFEHGGEIYSASAAGWPPAQRDTPSSRNPQVPALGPSHGGPVTSTPGQEGLADVRPTIYTGLMAIESLEDERGVDVSQIRERLRLTPAERLDRLIHEVRTWDEIRAFASAHQS